MCLCDSGFTLQPDGRTYSASGKYFFWDCAVVDYFLCNQAVLFTLSKVERSVTIFYRSVFMLQKSIKLL